MQIAHFPDTPRPRWSAPVVGLGNFDGVHRGHRKLLDEVRRHAESRGGTAVAMIFDPHPPKVLRPDKAPPLLMTLEQKLQAFEDAGMAAVAIVRFTRELSRWEPETFVETVLIDWLRASEVWVGANFLFGRDRSGTFTLLRALGEDRGFKVDKIDPVFYKDFVVSSTRIRRLVAEGRVDEAGALLGHHYAIEGEVVPGDRRGRELGFPTANLVSGNELLPAYGIYASIATIDGRCHPSVTSVGVRPTIGDGKLTVETHLLDGAQELYGARLRLSFVRWLRGEARFEDLGALRDQIARDAEDARQLFRKIAI